MASAVTQMEPVDVAIVGAGAAGSVLAAKLAAAGKSVVLLEAGPKRSPSDLISSQLWARRLRWGGPPVRSEGSGPVSFGLNGGWGDGGAALHHYATWPRLKVADFKVHTLYGRGLDWPLEYDTLRPFYDEIQQEVGIAGDAAAEIWRPPGAPYPMPALRRTAQADAIARGFKALDKHVAPTPLAINSVVYNGRAACLYDGWCDSGCPIGALANPVVTYLSRALEKGARVINNALTQRVVVSRAGQVDAIEYRDGRGELRMLRARHVILAASAIGNPTILLNSSSSLYPHGIGNRHSLLGRYLMTHGQVLISGFFAAETEPHLGVSGAILMSHDDYEKTTSPGAFGSRQWLLAPALKPGDFARFAPGALHGSALEEFVRRGVRHGAAMVCMAEEMPSLENRVELESTSQAGGMRRTRLVHALSADSSALLRVAGVQGESLFKAAGAKEITSMLLPSAHLMGGTVMGSSPSDSVTDSYGRVHEFSNLWVAGAGLFPTTGAVNPTFTLQALALRTARHLLGTWSSFLLQ